MTHIDPFRCLCNVFYLNLLQHFWHNMFLQHFWHNIYCVMKNTQLDFFYPYILKKGGRKIPKKRKSDLLLCLQY